MLDGKASGVFATRTPHRPNPIGLTLVAIDSVDPKGGLVHFRGVDVIDGTPILDIKPFVPYEALDCGASSPAPASTEAAGSSVTAARNAQHPAAIAAAAVLRYPSWLTAEGRKVTPLRVVEIQDDAAGRLRKLVADRVLQLYTSYDDVWAAIKEAIQLDIRRVHHRHKFSSSSCGAAADGSASGGGATYGFCMDVLNVVFGMTAVDSARVVEVEHWSGRYGST